jgi:hypothetical protein
MKSKDQLKAYVDPNLPKVLRERIPHPEYVEDESPNKTREKLAKIQGMLDIVAVLETMLREQQKG